MIIDRTPDQMKLNFMLWTRQAISELVMRLYKIELSLRCVTNYLRRWGFTCQRATKKAYLQDNIKVDRFMKEEYPAITNKGKVRFMMFDDNMSQQKLIEFMKRMIKDVPQKVFLILDNLRVHHGKLVQKWLEENKKRIEVFYLPPYSPKLNPDEYLNHALKLDVHLGISPRTKKDIRHKTQSFMRKLQHSSERVKAFFKHPKVAYIQ